MEQIIIKRVWIDSEYIYAEAENGDCARYPFSKWPRLAYATDEQRKDFKLSYFGIHWPALDEDLSFEGMFRDNRLAENKLVVYPN